jgi:integrase
MKRPDFWERPTLARAFEQFLESAPFARRTRESYADDLAPLLTRYGQADVSVLTPEIIQAFLRAQGWHTEELLAGVERKPERTRVARALDAQRVESVLRQITDPRDRALFWLIYDGGLRCQEVLAIDLEDISWSDRSILIHGKGGRPREMFFLPCGWDAAGQIPAHPWVSPLRSALCHASQGPAPSACRSHV